MRTAFLAVMLLVACLFPASSEAGSLNFLLDRTFCGGPPEPGCPGGPWGTVAIADNATNANRVDVTLDMTNESEFRQIWLNFDHSLFPVNQDKPQRRMLAFFGADVAHATVVQANVDSRKADGYGTGLYDLEIEVPAHVPDSLIVLTLCYGTAGKGDPQCVDDAGNLDPENFDFLDSHVPEPGISHVAVLRNSAAQAVPNYLTDGPAAVPEPALLLLLGGGVVGLGTVSRRRQPRR